MRRLIYILMLSFLLAGNLPSATYALTVIADIAVQNTFKPETDDLAACAADPAADMHGNNYGVAGKPVSLLSGAEGFSRTDISIGSIIPISVARRYDSRAGYDSPVGFGWAINYDRRLYTYSDGSVTLRKECGWKRRFTLAGGSYVTPIGETGTLIKNADGSFTYTEKNGEKDNYDTRGRLISRFDAKGNSLALYYELDVLSPLWGILPANISQATSLIVAYDYRLSRIEERDASGAMTNKYILFHYNSMTGRLTDILDNTGRSVTYGHDGIGNLTSVSGPGGSSAYGYGDTTSNHRMTSVDEGQGAYANTYDANGKVTRQTHGTGQIDFEYLDLYKKTRITTLIKDSFGNVLNAQVRTTEFDGLGQPAKVTDNNGNATTYMRDGKGRILAEGRTDIMSGVTTTNAFAYDSVGNMLTKTEAQGTAAEKTTTYTYHPVFNGVLTETVQSEVNPALTRVITNTYDDTNGNLLTTTEAGFLGNGSLYSYTTTYTYSANGKLATIDGSRTDVSDVTTYNYDSATGNLLSTTQPIIGTTTYSNFDGLGNPQTVTDPNNNSTTYTYDTNGRVSTVKAPGDTNLTQYFYISGSCGSSCSGSGKIDHITLPEGNTITYTYDAMGNMASIKDSQNNSINYTYDSEGNKLTEEIRDSGSSLQKSLSYSYDALNRLSRITNPDSNYTEYAYDAQGNKKSAKDPKNNLTSYSYDELSRLKIVTQPGPIDTIYGYNANNNLTFVKDANNNTTTYIYDDKGRVYQVISPDTGTTTYVYDPAGNLISKTDAKNVAINYTYDVLNRLITIDYPNDVDTIHAYDTCLNGKGRLCTMADASGTTTYEYSFKGQVTKETKLIDSRTYITQYTYDQNGNMKTMTYPSGKVITYNYANDRAVSVLNGAANLATSIMYKPFGGVSSLVCGNGLTNTITYDTQYRLVTLTTGTIQNIYGYDYNGNITSITPGKAYSYDALDRLGTATGPWGSLGWTYDGVGNRQTENANTYTYTPNTNKLSSANGNSFGYDNNGNTTAEGARQFVYNQNQRLIQVVDSGVTKGEYTYNGNGQRVKKIAAGVTTIFHYNLNGQIIAESNSAGTVTAEYVYLNGQPLAKLEGAHTNYYHNDHLGTPQRLTDSTGTVVWAADYKPFGETTITVSTITNNLRFPGQNYDAETGLNYNYYRDFNPAIGRYIEADPIGIMRGNNHLFVYVKNDPLGWIDQQGLFGDGIKANTGDDFKGHSDFQGYPACNWAKEDQGWSSPFVPWSIWRHFRNQMDVLPQIWGAINSCDKDGFERYMHQAQDYYTHYAKGYRALPIHGVHPKNWLPGHAGAGMLPDHDMVAWQNASNFTDAYLGVWNGKCPCKKCL